MIRNISAWHVIIVLVVVLLLFGANRLPALAKSIGQSMKIFKNEVKDLTDDGRRDGTSSSAPETVADGSTDVPPPPPAAPPAPPRP
ncbi:twin-arginine translocation protein, TatA/E family subunit [Cellulomonas flavigena DSM 20109]|uniref:Sec-independent protein translocase protein TatA n=1 Tax=Cellulomonas flavigena (strain ATCC 482 / DSM 20109 / BCRC 11376 / JCM 18109 / NBRC 3775 / NCIMB 8073 / NRS 134) TaxID=446466 RepID=D5UEV6_CELFN|nr:Sec-independent protein translocase subunit TatA [Cellulomonas flavigena]ADG74766.1 twin-arginine translocation protein, TatA/E family subunit [Cellulomonas flavigena DSM 20109]